MLFGYQEGLEVVITDAMELHYEVVNDEIKISKEYIDERKQLYSDVYVNLEIMGWYSVGSASVSTADLNIHRFMSTWNESPLFLVLVSC